MYYSENKLHLSSRTAALPSALPSAWLRHSSQPLQLPTTSSAATTFWSTCPATLHSSSKCSKAWTTPSTLSIEFGRQAIASGKLREKYQKWAHACHTYNIHSVPLLTSNGSGYVYIVTTRLLPAHYCIWLCQTIILCKFYTPSFLCFDFQPISGVNGEYFFTRVHTDNK